ELAAGFGPFVRDDDLPARRRKPDCRREASRSGADDEYVAIHRLGATRRRSCTSRLQGYAEVQRAHDHASTDFCQACTPHGAVDRPLAFEAHPHAAQRSTRRPTLVPAEFQVTVCDERGSDALAFDGLPDLAVHLEVERPALLSKAIVAKTRHVGPVRSQA